MIKPDAKTYEKLIPYIRKMAQTGWADMDVINAAFGKIVGMCDCRILPNVITLPCKYLILNSELAGGEETPQEEHRGDRDGLTREVVILHFTNGGKPWQRRYPSRTSMKGKDAHPLYHESFESFLAEYDGAFPSI